ncbi:Polyketide cyclase / dehydrase and lipid transport [Streptomyces sp. YIM 130001]|uniref:SRPBCC family protein n=1 Tax=Streptomyces sp. YIM 130001 TaxID=2259644 RepID=UPI000E646139|nr:SRPBCC family protein [Streptomyces sp. YIM 130001]RII20957.1 Polyketide cyclase / dehydrase and lipid transport [Streptomyces sp. YIM 130001]
MFTTRSRTAALAISLAAIGALGVAASPAQAAAPSAQARSGHHTGAPECGGQGVDPDALVRYRSEILIDAPLRTVFKTQTDVESWPSWQDAVLTSQRLDSGPLRAGSSFHWTTPVPATPSTPATTLDITSSVEQLERNQCVRWTGPADGEGIHIDEGTHVWTFTKVKGGVLVRTEETWTGDQAEADVPTSTEALGAGLEIWLKDLKAAAEARAAC